MMWLVLLSIVVCLIMVLRKRSLAKPNLDHLNDRHNGITHEIPLEVALVDADTEEDDIIAVITAAIHEFIGTGDFEVVSIKQSGGNWILTGRQNALRNR